MPAQNGIGANNNPNDSYEYDIQQAIRKRKRGSFIDGLVLYTSGTEHRTKWRF
jgi:hypothetical protein